MVLLRIETTKKITSFGRKAFQQGAAFIRRRENPLDNSAVHPEAYSMVAKD
jgi:uncharacterized protein